MIAVAAHSCRAQTGAFSGCQAIEGSPQAQTSLEGQEAKQEEAKQVCVREMCNSHITATAALFTLTHTHCSSRMDVTAVLAAP